MKIVLLDGLTLGDDLDLSELLPFGELTVHSTTATSEVAERINGFDCIITNKVVISEEHIRATSTLKLICVAATGTNNIDLEAAKKHQVQVKNVSGYSTEGVAQHTLAMILHGNQHLSYHQRYSRESYYQSPFFSHHGNGFSLLKNKQLGIIGMGAIGQEVARLASAFGMKISYHSISGQNKNQPFQHLSWEELLASSDIISIHAPLSSATYHLFNQDAFSKIKKGSMIINTGRGGIIDEHALLEALNKDIISFAALDVFEKEPIEQHHPLLNVPEDKLLLTPHVAWAAKESRQQLLKGIIQNIRTYSATNR